MDKGFAGKNTKAGILGKVGNSLRAPAKEVMVGVILAKSNLDGFARNHQNQQASWAQFFSNLTQSGIRV